MNYTFLEGDSDLLVFFHQTGGNADSLLFLRQHLNPKASVISFEGNIIGKQRRFFKPLISGETLQITDFEKQIDDFFQTWNTLQLKNYQNITLIGYSNGANFLQGILSRKPDTADGYILLHPMDLGINFFTATQKPILITTGVRDTLMPSVLVQHLAHKLQQTVFPNLTLKLFINGHDISETEIIEISDWFLEQKNT